MSWSFAGVFWDDDASDDMSTTPVEEQFKESITPEKVEALRQALDLDKRVTFKNGSVVRRTGRKGEGITVERHVGGKNYIVYTHFGTHSYEKAYELALHGPPRQPRSRPPFWFDPRKPRKRRPEWQECPF
jgi:hypothetical protein